jgi:hypothetical protein
MPWLHVRFPERHWKAGAQTGNFARCIRRPYGPISADEMNGLQNDFAVHCARTNRLSGGSFYLPLDDAVAGSVIVQLSQE